jgi:hypothetical protein
MYVCMHLCMYAWMYGWMYGCIYIYIIYIYIVYDADHPLGIMHTNIWKQQCWNKTVRGFDTGRPPVPRHSYERDTVDGIFNELLSRSADCIGIGLHGMKKDCPPTDSAAALKILLGNKRDQAKNMWHLKSSRWLLQCKQIEIIQI